MSARLFTSESVTEGHPDKICDQISDSILDAMLAQDPRSRVAVETMVTTGLVHVAGEVTTEAYVEIPKIVRDTVLTIGYDSSTKGFDGASCGVSASIGQQSPDIAQGVDTAFESRTGARRPARQAGRRRPGPDVRLRLRRHRRADAAADLPRAPPRRAAHRGAQGRRAALPAPRRQDPGHHRVRRRPRRLARRRGRLQPARRGHLARRHARARHPPARHRPGARRAARRRHRPAHRRLPRLHQPHRQVRHRWPDGGCRPHRSQDHRRHLRRHGPPRWRRLLRQGPEQGRPVRRLRHPLGRQERRRRGPGPPLRGAGRLRDRQGPAGRPLRRDLRHRDRPRREDPGRDPVDLRPAARRDPRRPRPAPPDLQGDGGLRPLRPHPRRRRRQRLHLGAHRPRRGAAARGQG